MYLYIVSAPTLLVQPDTPQVQCMVFPHVSQNWEYIKKLKFINIHFTVSSNTKRDGVIFTGIMHNVNAPTNLNDFHNYITKFIYLLHGAESFLRS